MLSHCSVWCYNMFSSKAFFLNKVLLTLVGGGGGFWWKLRKYSNKLIFKKIVFSTRKNTTNIFSRYYRVIGYFLTLYFTLITSTYRNRTWFGAVWVKIHTHSGLASLGLLGVRRCWVKDRSLLLQAAMKNLLEGRGLNTLCYIKIHQFKNRIFFIYSDVVTI